MIKRGLLKLACFVVLFSCRNELFLCKKQVGRVKKGTVVRLLVMLSFFLHDFCS